jgi:SdrD B-like domain/FG-GAP-like repeat/Subtilase family
VFSVKRHRTKSSKRDLRTSCGISKSHRQLCLESLEVRNLPSGIATPDHVVLIGPTGQPLDSAGPQGYSPAQVRHAYAIDQIAFNGQLGNGSGTTIAIVDAFGNPNIVGDLHAFDLQFGLPDPVLTIRDQNGGTNLPTHTDTTWAVETALDVEWAHAIAPAARILLVETNDDFAQNLFTGVATAANTPGVVAVSMSFGLPENPGDTSQNSIFLHPGVTFVASSGDSGAPGGYPAFSPNVLAVGGTTLNLDASGNVISQFGWSGSGGGISAFEPKPIFQRVVQGPSRLSPDVSYNADPRTGFSVYDSFTEGTAKPWIVVGGTSAGAPQWAALIAIADQGRFLQGEGPLSGNNQTLPLIYEHPSDFTDIVLGNNGFPAGPGYDYVTGLGTPIANRLVQDLIITRPSLSGLVFTDLNNNGVFDLGEAGLPGITITLTGVTDADTFITASVVSDAMGRYSFIDLPPGTYNLVETPPAAFLQGPAYPGNLGGIAGPNEITNIRINADQGFGYLFTTLGLISNDISKVTLLGSPGGLESLTGPAGSGVTVVDGPLQAGTHYIVTGAGPGHAPLVSVYSAATNALVVSFYAYDPDFLGGVRVALGDVNGDGVPDIITAPGQGGGPDVRIFDGRTDNLIGEFMAYDPRLTSGLFVAAADVNRDGFADIVTAPDVGGGPEVKVFGGRSIITGQPKLFADFMAYDPRFGGGVRVAFADVNHDGVPDLITGAGPGGGPDVRVFGGTGLPNAYPAGDIIREFYAFAPTYNGGVNVAGSDINGDGFADILVSGATTSAEVRVYSGLNLALLGDFLGENAAEPAGLNIAALPTGIVTGGGTTSTVSVFNPTSHALLDRFFTDASELTGVYVGGI